MRSKGDDGTAAGSRRVLERPALRLCAPHFKLTERLAPQAIEFAQRQEHLAFEKVFQFAEPERGSAQTAELLAQPFCREWLLLGPRQRHLRLDPDDMPDLVPNDQRERVSRSAVNLEADRPLESRLIARKRRAQPALELGIAGFPNPVADMNPRHVNLAAPETQLGFTR